jgi:hypothetical protein
MPTVRLPSGPPATAGGETPDDRTVDGVLQDKLQDTAQAGLADDRPGDRPEFEAAAWRRLLRRGGIGLLESALAGPGLEGAVLEPGGRSLGFLGVPEIR